MFGRECAEPAPLRRDNRRYLLFCHAALLWRSAVSSALVVRMISPSCRLMAFSLVVPTLSLRRAEIPLRYVQAS